MDKGLYSYWCENGAELSRRKTKIINSARAFKRCADIDLRDEITAT